MKIGELLTDLANRGIHLWVEEDRLRFSAPDARALDETTLAAVRDRRDELLGVLSAVHPATRPVPVAKAPADAEVRCSHAQERLLFSAELDGSSNPYRLNAAFRVVGALDVAALQQSVEDIVRRHDVLRCRFKAAGDGFVIVPSDWRPVIELVDFTGSEADLLASIAHEQRPEFDLMHGPHLEVTLYRLGARRHVLFVSMHHIVSDGASIRVFARELEVSYAWRAGFVSGPPPNSPLQFRDVAYAERTAPAGDEARLLAFWKRELEDAPGVLALPTNRPRPAARASAGGSIPLRLDAALFQRLQEVKKAFRLSDFHVVVAALWLLLHKYSHQWSIVVGTPWSNRARPGSEDVIGPLLNLLPLHVRLGPDATVRDLLAEVKRRTLAAMEHGAVPFERIVSHVRASRSSAYTPLFQVMCAIDATPQDAMQLAELTIEAIELPNEAARYDLAIVLAQTATTLSGAMKYDRALFDEATAQRMARHFAAALELVLCEPATRVARAQLMDAAERETLFVEWNRTSRPYPLDKTLVDLFADRVAASPERVAVTYQGRSLTYRELDRWADAVAHRLRAAGVATDDVVGVTLGRSLEIVVAIVGVLKSGAAYLPIDVQHPAERRTWMLENAGVKAVIGPSAVSVPHVDVGTGAVVGIEDQGDPERRQRPDSACYAIYTSGSTGVPKAVVVGHRAIANNLLWMNDEWPLTEHDAVLFKSSPGFDVAVKEVFWPLIAGAKLVVAPPEVSGDPERLAALIRDERISVVHMVPTFLDFFLRHESAARAADLRIVMCGGEALSAALAARAHAAFDAVLLHLYGPTEAAIAVTGCAVPARSGEERLPLGWPMPNCRIYVVDAQLQAVPVGVPGQLCIAGTPLARGYLGRPDLTAETFVPEPFSGIPGARMYLTGDLARRRADGALEYLGRIDRQIKLGGFRVEPGEIEAVIRAQAGVDDAVVLLTESGGHGTLVAYVASRARDVSAETLQRGLRARLPAYMIPARFVVVATFSTNVNGKVDVASLPLSDLPAVRPAANPPTGQLEERIARIWCEVLDLETAERDDDFFDLGGHSLSVLQLQAQLRDQLGYRVTVGNLFLHPTVASLAAHIADSNVERAKRWLKRSFAIGRRSAS
jgi:amino acid adenylation domain-containing protein